MKREINELTELFEIEDFDIDIYKAEPGHKNRFFKNLDKGEKKKILYKKIYYSSMAAAILIFISVGYLYTKTENINYEYSTTTVDTEVYFTKLIAKEISWIEARTHENDQVIFKELLIELEILKEEQNKLMSRMKININDYLLSALIDNFNYQIQIIKNVKKQIQLNKQINTEHDEYI